MLGNFWDNFVFFMTDLPSVMFFLFAVLAISGAVFALSLNKVIHMVVSLAVTFVSLAGLYVLLDAEFVAFVQILIYAGAISILMIFAIMMTKHQEVEEPAIKPWKSILTAISAISLFGILFYAIQTSSFPNEQAAVPADNTMEIGLHLFTEHVIPFELMSVLLTVAFIGAIIIAKREEE
jgi:NADH-quinone oxidoreductase subunit J